MLKQQHTQVSFQRECRVVEANHTHLCVLFSVGSSDQQDERPDRKCVRLASFHFPLEVQYVKGQVDVGAAHVCLVSRDRLGLVMHHQQDGGFPNCKSRRDPAMLVRRRGLSHKGIFL